MGLQAGQRYCPSCGSEEGTWTDDPILTPKGQSGTDYIGCTWIKPEHIEELQAAREQQEIDAGIAEGDRTQFSPVNSYAEDGTTHMPGIFFIPDKKHIKELRDSTEKILQAMNLTLSDYLNFDAVGNRMYQYKWDAKTSTRVQRPYKVDWTDPNIDDATFKVKAIHIEELRCTLPADIPMYIINKGLGYTSTQSGSVIVSAGYNEHVIVELGIWNMWVVQTITTDEKDGIDGIITYWRGYEPIVADEPPGTDYWTNGGGPEAGRVAAWYCYAGGIIYNVYRYYNVYSGWQAKVTCIPRTNNLDIPEYTLQEIISPTTLVAETPGYPCQMYAGDSWYYSVGMAKSCGYLEDVIASLGVEVAMPKETYAQTVIFKEEHITPSVAGGGVSEPKFDTRRIDGTSWGMSSPDGLFTSEYLRSVSFNGTNACGNFSIFIPKSWLTGTLRFRRRNNQICYTFQDDCIYFVTPTSWLIDLTSQEQDDSYNIYDPSTNTYPRVRFGGNCILAKRDDDNFVAGLIIANDYQEFSENIDEDTTEISLPTDTVVRSVKLNIDGEEWTRVTDWGGYTKDDRIFKVEDDKIVFGNGGTNSEGVGYRVNHATTASIKCYVDEIVPTTIYPSGYAAIPYDPALKDTSVYIYYEYYQAPSNYNALADNEVLYECSYWAKPATGGYDLGSGAWPPATECPSNPSATCGLDLPTPSALAKVRLHP